MLTFAPPSHLYKPRGLVGEPVKRFSRHAFGMMRDRDSDATTKGRSTGLSTSSTIDFSFADGIAPMLRGEVFVTFLCVALFSGSAASEQPQRPPGPVMMVHFDYYPKDRARIRVLERRLESAIKHAGVGELGETEYHIDGNDGYLYMYGPNPDRLYGVTGPILKSSRLMTGAEVTKHYGPRAETFAIHPDGIR
jgi:hypothetical protein